uniref:ribosomal protein S3 n=1 Tax=Prototheca moriformis TaxID=183676 RepID=UPI0030036DED
MTQLNRKEKNYNYIKNRNTFKIKKLEKMKNKYKKITSDDIKNIKKNNTVLNNSNKKKLCKINDFNQINISYLRNQFSKVRISRYIYRKINKSNFLEKLKSKYENFLNLTKYVIKKSNNQMSYELKQNRLYLTKKFKYKFIFFHFWTKLPTIIPFKFKKLNFEKSQKILNQMKIKRIRLKLRKKVLKNNKIFYSQKTYASVEDILMKHSVYFFSEYQTVYSHILDYPNELVYNINQFVITLLIYNKKNNKLDWTIIREYLELELRSLLTYFLPQYIVDLIQISIKLEFITKPKTLASYHLKKIKKNLQSIKPISLNKIFNNSFIYLKYNKYNFPGMKIRITGRLNGAERAKTTYQSQGKVAIKTYGTWIDYASGHAITKYGVLGIKVWIDLGISQSFSQFLEGETFERKKFSTFLKKNQIQYSYKNIHFMQQAISLYSHIYQNDSINIERIN